MAVPTIQVTNTQGDRLRSPFANGGAPEPPSPVHSQDATESQAVGHVRGDVPSPAETIHPIATLARSNGAPHSGVEQHRPSQTTIDPLSHHILKRTNTESMIPQKLRAGMGEAVGRDHGSSATPSLVDGSTDGGRRSTDKVRGEDLNSREKKKGVSFLSRIIGTKKKDSTDDLPDSVSETGERRTEGMHAHVFSQPILSNGFTPHHPPPPKYIRTRTHNKKTPDFNRVFLAQELHGRDASREEGKLRYGNSSDTLPSQAATNAIWALEFSIDGKYLAVGGQDKTVRVWAVISTSQEREMHESEEDATSIHAGSQPIRLNAPVFKTKPIREYEGHTSDVLDLSWSKNNFLLSSSMDKTVRLWHASRGECLCCFKHSDFVTSISFHPRDDRFFLAGSLDSKLRLWSIPDKSVAYWNRLPDLITAVAFTPDGKTSIAGCLNGLCLLYETEGLRYHTQIHVRSSHGRNAKGSKITGIQGVNYPPDDLNADVKLLITSNDSRVRLYNFRDKSLEMKFRGNENTCSQIRASFSDDAGYVICGSEDRKVYIWSTAPAEGDKKDKGPVEMFTAHSAIVTTAIFAPVKTRQMLGRSGDPIYDLCNPPPVTLVSRTESRGSSRPPTEAGRRPTDQSAAAPPTSATVESRLKSVTPAEESPSYIARSAHPDGNIIVSADYLGTIKVFRQDCAYSRRRKDTWDTASTFSKKIGTGLLGRSATTMNMLQNGNSRARRSSLSSHPASDRIISWRNAISSHSSLDNAFRTTDRTRSASPRKSTFARTNPAPGSTPLTHHDTPSFSNSSSPRSLHKPSTGHLAQRHPNTTQYTGGPPAADPASNLDPDPMMLQQGGQSLAFWNVHNWNRAGTTQTTSQDARPADNPALERTVSGQRSRRGSFASAVSVLSSEIEDERERQRRAALAEVGDDVSEGENTLRCRVCAGTSFKARTVGKNSVGGVGAGALVGGGGGQTVLVCTSCGTPA